MDENKKRIYTTSELAEVMGLSGRRIRQLEKEGVFPKVARGRWDIAQVMQGYVSCIKAQAAKSGEELDLTQERTLLTRANRKKAELELQIMKGELHRSEDVEWVMNDMLGAFRARCLTIPSKTAPRLQGQTELAVIQNIIKKEIYEALLELSDYDPEVFYKQSKDTLVLENKEETPLETPEKETPEKEMPQSGRRKKK